MELADAELVTEFVIESQEGLANIEQQMLAIEAGGADVDLELVNSVFRTMHTIKGTSGFIGLDRIGSLAHGLEEVLDDLRNRKLAASSELVTTVLRAADFMKGLIDAVETSNDADISEHVAALQRFRSGAQSSSPQSAVAVGAPSDTAPSDAVREYLDECRENLDGPDRVSPSPGREASGVPPIAHVQEARLPAVPTHEQRAVAASAASSAASSAEGSSAEKSGVPTGESTIRVDVGLLDKLMTRVGELVLARNQIVQYAARMEDSSFAGTAQRLNLITTELQESVMKTRMQPIGNVWSKFPRVVRDLASQLGKQVRIEMEGKETELDKTIIEAIKDPLTHLVRNSVDHGIETPEARCAANKPAEGCLTLRAYHEGGRVNIEIADDGAGLNIERIRRKAVERGLVSPDQAARLNDRDAAQLIFAPGFSTAETVTSVSGRGVGMDVVKTNIERISGTIDLQSAPGEGTTIRIKIPLTLAIIPALVVTNDGDRYAIPQVSLLELVRLENDDAKRGIEYVHGAPVYRLRGKLLPLIYLSERLGLPPRVDDGVVNIVVLRANDRQFGLVVDKVNDTEEIVVKPLSRQLKGLPEYAGATIMGDGAVALILDVMGLTVAAGLAAEMREQPSASVAKSDESGRPVETLLVVDLGDARRFALPTSMVSRLEKVARSSVEYADGREVIQYRGAILPLIRLSEVFGADRNAEQLAGDLQIVVYDDQERHCGFVVGRILDVVETELRTESSEEDDVLLGTSVIQRRVTDVLNLRLLARRPAAAKFARSAGYA